MHFDKNKDGFFKLVIFLLSKREIWYLTILHKIMLVIIGIHFVSTGIWLFERADNEPLITGTFWNGATNTPLDKLMVSIAGYAALVGTITILGAFVCWRSLVRERMNTPPLRTKLTAYSANISKEESAIFGRFNFLGDLKCSEARPEE